MVASILRILIFVLFPSFVLAQSMDLSVPSPTNNNDSSTFLVEEGEVTIRSNSIRFLNSGKRVSGYDAFGISPDYSVVSLLERTGESGELIVLNSSGDTLNTYSTVSLGEDDPSLGVYPSERGNVLLRDKITNFTFYDTFGEILTNMSSSSQSEEGEAISEVKMNPTGKTVVIYNPKIKRDNNLGSKIQVKKSDNSFKEIFYSSDRFLKDITIADDGNIIVGITAQEGTDDEVIVMDKYGEVFNRISVEESLVGASLSSDNEYLSLYSPGRVMVRSTLNGESKGATSSRSTVFFADYFPEDNIILVLTGSYSEQAGVLNNVEFRAVDLEKRKITSEEFSGSLGFNKAMEPRFERVSSNQYQLLGASKRVKVGVDF